MYQLDEQRRQSRCKLRLLQFVSVLMVQFMLQSNSNAQTTRVSSATNNDSPGYIAPSILKEANTWSATESNKLPVRLAPPPMPNLLRQSSPNEVQPVLIVPDQAEIPSQLSDLQHKKAESLQQLQKRAEQIQALWEQRQRERIESQVPAIQDVPPQMPIPVPVIPLNEDLPINPPLAEDVTTENIAEEVVKSAVPVVPEVAQPLPPEIVEGPIDRLAMAGSLFATHRYDACMKTLQVVDSKTLSNSDQLWATYLKASCYRKTGDIENAEKLYRELVNTTQDSWITEVSRWWLSHLNQRSGLERDIVKLNITLKNWQGEIDALTTRP